MIYLIVTLIVYLIKYSRDYKGACAIKERSQPSFWNFFEFLLFPKQPHVVAKKNKVKLGVTIAREVLPPRMGRSIVYFCASTGDVYLCRSLMDMSQWTNLPPHQKEIIQFLTRMLENSFSCTKF